jgi:Tfp pilus assembly protein PilF
MRGAEGLAGMFFRKPYTHFLIISVIALISYSNTFDAVFHFDDFRFIRDNPLIRDFGYFIDPSKVDELELIEDVRRYFKTRFVSFLSFWVNYRLQGLDLRFLHAMNLAIHVVNAMLVYLLIALAFRTPLLRSSPFKESSWIISLLSALLFVAHPLQTEAVTYILSRLVLLAAMFYLLSIVAYIGSRISVTSTSRYGLYLLSIVSAVLGMKTKENVFTLPVAIAICEFMFFSDSFKKRVFLLGPFVLTMLIIPLAYIGLSMDAGSLGDTMNEASMRTDTIPRVHYLFTQFSVIVAYISLLLFPVGQNASHDHPMFSSFDFAVFLSLMFLLAMFGLGVYMLLRSRRGEKAIRLAAFGVFLFFLALSVESSVLPIGELMVEYRVYLPSAGFLIAIVTTGLVLFGRIESPTSRKAAVIALPLVVLVLSSATYARNNVWQSEISLWKDVVSKSPKMARPHNNLGVAYRDAGKLDTAIEQFQVALNLKPDYVEVHHNIGKTYEYKGMLNEAMEHYKTVIKIKPDNAKTYYNLARIYEYKGMIDTAVDYYRTALKLESNLVRAHNNLGSIYSQKGQYDIALEHFEEAIRLNPIVPAIYLNAGIVCRKKGSVDKAIEYFKNALRLDPNNTIIHMNLSIAYQEKGMYDKAEEHSRIATHGH